MSNVSPACAELLARSHHFGPLYGPRLANHLPMALIALDRLGADAAALQAFAAGYSKKLAPLPDEPGIVDPRDHLGSGKHYPQFVRYFERRIVADGREAVLREWVPVLMRGLAASAFHVMIRLAYAIDAEDAAETAHALAFWASEYLPLTLPMDTVDASPQEIAAGLARAVEGHVFAPGIIIDKMLEIARHPALAGAAIQPKQLSLRGLAQFCIQAYGEREDFTLLHTVTACHAFRLVLPCADDEQSAMRWLWQAVLLAYLTVPHPAGDRAPPPPPIGEEDIRRLACSSTDDHLIKLCYSALCEYREYGDTRYLQAARRKLAAAGLVPLPAGGSS